MTQIFGILVCDEPRGFSNDTNVNNPPPHTSKCGINTERLPVGVKVNDGTVGKGNK